eukprot:gene18840-6217_t
MIVRQNFDNKNRLKGINSPEVWSSDEDENDSEDGNESQEKSKRKRSAAKATVAEK